MTAIDLTRDQCAALAGYLRNCVPNGYVPDSFDMIELLVLAHRALQAAAVAEDDLPVVRIPTKEELAQYARSSSPEGGVT